MAIPIRPRTPNWVYAAPVGLGFRAIITGRGQSQVESADPYAGLNLGLHVGDDPNRVQRNRITVAHELGVLPENLVFMDQVHGVQVVEIGPSWAGDQPIADALVTKRIDLALAVMVADCVPVVLADPARQVLGVIHVGRAGLTSGIIAEVLIAMRDLGAQQFAAIVGPSICPRCYEVPLAMQQKITKYHPETYSITRTGTPGLDLAAGVLAQLAAGTQLVRHLSSCTQEDPWLYSYRRAPVTGRFAAVARLTPAGAG